MATHLESWRQQFPALANKAYFNYGGQGPLAQPALRAIQDAFESIQRLGPFSQRAGAWIDELTFRLRGAIARELNASLRSIVLTENVTAGCNIALWGLDWQPGDGILLGDNEHPGIIAAVQEVARRLHLHVGTVPLLCQTDVLSQVEAALTPQTRLLVISHVLWSNGQVLPLTELVQLCHQRAQPVRLLVDAAQAVGQLPLDLPATGVDFYAFTGHKWLCGPEGVGALYVDLAVLEDLHPTFIGWRSITKDEQGQPTGWQKDGRRYEVATSAYPLFAGLERAIALHNDWGTVSSRYERIDQLSSLLWQTLNQMSGVHCISAQAPSTGLVSFQLASGRHAELVRQLEEEGVCLRTLQQPNCVRACTHYLTLETEIAMLAQKISSFNSEGEH
jgi:L-cysteine/cystine lyase